MPTISYIEDENEGNVLSHANMHNNRLNHSRQNNNRMNHRTVHSESNYLDEPSRYLTNLARGRAVNFFINGNVFFPSRKLVFNPKQFKDFSNYMDYLTEKLDPTFGAVRKICTPNHGHRILDLTDLQDNGVYVVAGSERFKMYRYDQIAPRERRRSPPFNYNVDPVYHNRLYASSGKIKKSDTQSLLIKVWPNGGDLQGPRRVLISPRIKPYTLSTVLSHINEMLKEDCLGTVEKLYFLTGAQVSDVDQIIQNGQYVACRKTDKFKKAHYNEHAVKNMAISPRLDRRILPPLYPRSINNSLLQSSPDYSNASTQNSVASYSHRGRRGPDRTEDDRVFPARPVKYTRGSEKVRTLDLDKDQSGIFRAKQNNGNTRGAREVADSRHMKTDLPVDHWEAQEVDDEDIKVRDKLKTDRPRNGYHIGGGESKTNNKRAAQANNKKIDSHAQQLDQSAAKIQAGYRGYTARKDMAATGMQNSATARQKRRYSPDDSLEKEHEAATKIQAGFRGYQSRRQLSSVPSQPEYSRKNNHKDGKQKADYTDLQRQKPKTISDPKQKIESKPAAKNLTTNREQPSRKQRGSTRRLSEQDKAAVKIQASFRGYQTRKRISEEKTSATKIQSGFRGHQERKTFSPTKKIQPRSNAGKVYEDDEDVPRPRPKDKGYMNSSRPPPSMREDSYDELDKENMAAQTIQSHYRGYRARQEFASQ